MTTTTACPYCHQPQNTQSDSDDQFSEPHNTEVTYIQNETRRIDRLVAELLGKRAVLLGRLNSIQSPTKVFPPETLSLIFGYACSSDSTLSQRISSDTLQSRKKFQHPQLILGAVSSHWRQIAHSTPQLWTSANFDIYQKQWRKLAHRLRLFFEKSRALPMTLTLHFRSRPIFGFDEKMLVHSSIDHLILNNLPRIRRLHLIEPPPRWHSIPDCLFQLTNFSLEDANSGRSPKSLCLLNSSSLRNLTLNYRPEAGDVDYKVCWDALTKLDFDGVPFYACAEFLLRCPNLIEYSCRCPVMPFRDEEWPNPPDLIVKNQLRTFHWGSFRHHDNHDILRAIRLPVLQTLEWNTIWESNGGHDLDINDINFLTNLPSTLSTLELCEDVTLLDVGPLLQLSNIEHLILRNTYNYTMLEILERLGSNGQGMHNPDANRCLPGLKKLTIGEFNLDLGDDDLEVESGWNFPDAVVEMLVRRFDGSDTIQFRVETTGISLNDSDKLKDLMNRGMELEMTETWRSIVIL